MSRVPTTFAEYARQLADQNRNNWWKRMTRVFTKGKLRNCDGRGVRDVPFVIVETLSHIGNDDEQLVQLCNSTCDDIRDRYGLLDESRDKFVRDRHAMATLVAYAIAVKTINEKFAQPDPDLVQLGVKCEVIAWIINFHLLMHVSLPHGNADEISTHSLCQCGECDGTPMSHAVLIVAQWHDYARAGAARSYCETIREYIDATFPPTHAESHSATITDTDTDCARQPLLRRRTIH